MNENRKDGWADEEFEEVNLGDQRLDARLITLCNRFSDAPESPINQACADWAETKAAYRFFQNEKVEADDIMAAHRRKTVLRAKQHDTILAVQDTSYLVYTSHLKTEGLGEISMKKGSHVDKIYSKGLVMHTCLALTTQGLPLGLLDQKVFARKLRPEHQNRRKGGRYIQDVLPVEEKESYRWIDTLRTSKEAVPEPQVVTVCDREADLYDLFKESREIDAAVLVRASANRTVNRKSRYAEKDVQKLWDFMHQQTEAGTYTIQIPKRAKTKHCAARDARCATVSVRFAPFCLNPPRNNPKHKTEKLPDIDMVAIYVHESDPPDEESQIEWMLLTNLPVLSFESACEKIRWYSLRWRIEMYFKVLKSGFRVEACRLGHAERLMRYLTVMSIVAWRLFMVTLIARTDPDAPCTRFLTDDEWTVLYRKMHKNKAPPKNPPCAGDVIIWIAKLGGFLARKNDGPPGTISLWRGWKRLTDLNEGWGLATQQT